LSAVPGINTVVGEVAKGPMRQKYGGQHGWCGSWGGRCGISWYRRL